VDVLQEVGRILRAYPGFIPGAVLSLVVATVTSRAAARSLRTGRGLAFTVLLGLGLILSATLAPSPDALRDGLGGGESDAGRARCDFRRLWPASPRDLLAINETSFNVLLFVPLGAAVALLPRSRRRAAIIVSTAALPFAIEATQLLLPSIGRACQGSDVADNLTGLALGAIVGTVGGRLIRRAAAIPNQHESRT
jgi:hypothetical protein